jgi:uncharacterized protein YbcV (DUF1398 family)
MNEALTKIAQACLEGAERDTMTFPQIVGTLMQGGFESYAIDFRRASATYYLPDGDSVVLPAHRCDSTIAAKLDTAALQAAIREAQQLVPGYTYAGFCLKAMKAGCAGYVVSFSGRRAVYFARTAETHVEHFPQQASLPSESLRARPLDTDRIACP